MTERTTQGSRPSRVIALGEGLNIQGFALAAVELWHADDPEAIKTAWGRLPADVAVVLLTPMAASVLGELLIERPSLLWAVMP